MTLKTATPSAPGLLPHAFAAYRSVPAVELTVLAFVAGLGIGAILFGSGMNSRWRLARSLLRRGGSGPPTHAHAEPNLPSGRSTAGRWHTLENKKQ